MKPNGALEASAILREKRPCRGAALLAGENQTTRSAFNDLCEIRGGGVWPISLGRKDPSGSHHRGHAHAEGRTPTKPSLGCSPRYGNVSAQPALRRSHGERLWMRSELRACLN